MSTIRSVLRRFRSEIRDRDDVRPKATVSLADIPERANNVRAAELLLKETFGDQITVSRCDDGLVCGSREEASALRLSEYTLAAQVDVDMLLSSLTRQEIETYLKDRTGECLEVFVPDTPEARFIEELAGEFEDVRYGL